MIILSQQSEMYIRGLGDYYKGRGHYNPPEDDDYEAGWKAGVEESLSVEELQS